MHEATRLQYLALLGIEQWLPRMAVDAAVEPAGPATAHASEPANTGAAPAPALPSPERAAQLGAMLAESTAASRRAAAPASAPAPQTASPGPAPAGERVGCSFLALDGGLLVVAAFVVPHAPGLSGPEHALLANIVAALAPGSALPATLDFSWPPAGMRVPGMDSPGAGREALAGLLAEHHKRGVRDVVVLGHELAALVAEASTRLGMRQAGGPSLAAMLADPAAKRDCWEAVRVLRREPRG